MLHQNYSNSFHGSLKTRQKTDELVSPRMYLGVAKNQLSLSKIGTEHLSLVSSFF